jgi:hypothetical protein
MTDSQNGHPASQCIDPVIDPSDRDDYGYDYDYSREVDVRQAHHSRGGVLVF